MKPKVFIGSSVEGLKVAYAIQENLEHDVLCTPWNQGVFELSGNTLENLISSLDKFDFAIFVLSADDVLKIRKAEFTTVRDNVIFELGLFIGKMGKDKVFFVIPRHQENLHLPTDLAGITPGSYDDGVRDDLRSALGPFCNKVRRQINSFTENLNVKRPQKEQEKNEEVTNIDTTVEYGVVKDSFGNFTITIPSDDFFYGRFTRAFPGIRGLEIIEDPRKCIDRLLILLKPHLTFENSERNGIRHPIWWFRDGSNMYIQNVEKINDVKILIDIQELIISKIGVYHSPDYNRCFLYVETAQDVQTGLYNFSDSDIHERINTQKKFTEEYAIFENQLIRREEYDDGAAVIDGRVVDINGAKLRLRHLTPYNFLITSQNSPINSNEFDRYSGEILDGILSKKRTIHDLCDFVKKLPKHPWR